MKKILNLIFLMSAMQMTMAQTAKRELSADFVAVNGTINVTLKIARDGVTGAGKIEEMIPVGFSAVVTEKSMGNVSLKDDNKIKVQWLNLPANDTILVQYKLRNISVSTGQVQLKGKFSYMKDGNFQKYEMAPSTLSIGNVSPIASSKPKTPTQTKVSNTEVAVSTKKEVPTETSVSAVEKESKLSVNESVQPVAAKEQRGASKKFAIQLGAFSVEKNKSMFDRLPDIHMKRVNGLYKYYTGNFASEEEARKRLALARAQGFGDAFLVTQN